MWLARVRFRFSSVLLCAQHEHRLGHRWTRGRRRGRRVSVCCRECGHADWAKSAQTRTLHHATHGQWG